MTGKIEAYEIARRLEGGEATEIGKRAEKGNKKAMKVITTYVLWQRYITPKTQHDFEDAYIRYKKSVNERIKVSPVKTAPNEAVMSVHCKKDYVQFNPQGEQYTALRGKKTYLGKNDGGIIEVVSEKDISGNRHMLSLFMGAIPNEYFDIK